MTHDKLRLPIKLLILDAIGVVFVVVGALEWFSQVGLVPEPLRFARFELALIAVGIILMMPLITHIASHIKRNKLAARSDLTD